MSRYIDADILIQDIIQEYARSKQYRDAIIRMVNKAPTVEPKRGEWIDFKNGWKCNACKKWSSERSNFCPNCGADMRLKTHDICTNTHECVKDTHDKTEHTEREGE